MAISFRSHSLGAVVLFSLFFATLILAAAPAEAVTSATETGRSGQSVTLENPLGASNSNLAAFLAKLLQALIFVGLPFAALFLLWAGFQFVWARGNTEKLETARRNLLYIVIGIAIFVAASAIATLIGRTIDQLK